MRGFDESWLKSYEARQAGASATLPDMIRFDLPFVLPSLNTLIRLHWSQRGKLIRSLSGTVAALTVDLPRGAAPIDRARVTVIRHAIQEIDPDNLAASAKHLLDVLQPRSERHPHGLGLIAGDDPAHLVLDVQTEPALKRANQRTVVLIERIA